MIESLFSPTLLLLLLLLGLVLVLVVLVALVLAQVSKQAGADVGLESRFRRLVQLSQEGLITDDEYHAKREELMKHL